jgi:hypothetical protein
MMGSLYLQGVIATKAKLDREKAKGLVEAKYRIEESETAWIVHELPPAVLF